MPSDLPAEINPSPIPNLCTHAATAGTLAWLERFALWRSGSLLHDRAAARWADNDIAWFYRYLFVRYEAFRKRGDEPVAAGPERPDLVADVRPGAAAGAEFKTKMNCKL